MLKILFLEHHTADDALISSVNIEASILQLLDIGPVVFLTLGAENELGYLSVVDLPTRNCDGVVTIHYISCGFCRCRLSVYDRQAVNGENDLDSSGLIVSEIKLVF